MEQGTLLQQQPLTLHDNFALPSEQDCIDQFSNPHPSDYVRARTVSQMRDDGTLTEQSSNAYLFTPTNHPHSSQFVAGCSVAPESNGYPAAQHFTDSSAGSSSTSPSSAASSVAYTNYPPNHYTSVTGFPGAVTQQQLSQAYIPSLYPTGRGSSILGGAPSTMLPPPQRSPINTFVCNADRDAYTATPLISCGPIPPSSYNVYNSYPETTPRSVLASTAALSLSPGPAVYSQMASPGGFGSGQNECANFPWPNLEVFLEMSCEGQQVTPEVHAKVEKGFFMSTVDQKWTCYRRNYFSVQCNFELHPNINNGRMYLKRNNTTQAIQAMGMRLSAAVDGAGGKSIELIQHTPKRDNGPKTKIDVSKVSPTPPVGRGDHTISPHGVYQLPIHPFHATGAITGPYLPLQNVPSDGSSPLSSGLHASQQLPTGLSYASGGHLPLPGQTTTQSFERVQFKQATANNGKRRASQQYFHLIVELFADVRQDGDDQPTWVKVAHRVSEKIVVRGRSPSHYQNEGQNGTATGGAAGGRGGSTGSGGVYSSSAGSTATYGSMNPGAFRSSTGGYSSLGNGNTNGGYRNHSYGLQPSPENIPGSSPDSMVGKNGVAGADTPMDSTGMTEAERAGFQNAPGYQYYPGTLHEAGMISHQDGQTQRHQHTPYLPPLAKLEGTGRYSMSTEPRVYAVKTEYPTSTSEGGINGHNNMSAGTGSSPAPWSLPMSRYQGFESSRGLFPSDPPANYT